MASPGKTPYLDDGDFRLYNGEALDVLRSLPGESVHCVVTSPPYWGLRDYGTASWEGGNPDCDHAPQRGIQGTSEASQRSTRTFTGSKPQMESCGRCGARRVDQALGLEATPELYVARMVEVFREVRRVLRGDGVCWVNLGDSYASSPPGNVRGVGETSGLHGAATSDKYRDTLEKGVGSRRSTIAPGLKPKDLVGIPWRVAFALQADGWYLRSDVIWSKPNPMPESVTDRPTKAHEYVFLLTKSARYFFDQEAVREPVSPLSNFKTWDGEVRPSSEARKIDGPSEERFGNGSRGDPAGRNVRSVWEIATQPYPEAHFATYPEELVRRCVLAGTSERGCCPECGAPWQREVERERTPTRPGGNAKGRANEDRRDANIPLRPELKVTTLGWRPSCSHDPSPVPCTVLDPFGGSGTTALVARKHGRRSILIELSSAYCELAARRLSQLSLLIGGQVG